MQIKTYIMIRHVAIFFSLSSTTFRRLFRGGDVLSTNWTKKETMDSLVAYVIRSSWIGDDLCMYSMGWCLRIDCTDPWCNRLTDHFTLLLLLASLFHDLFFRKLPGTIAALILLLVVFAFSAYFWWCCVVVSLDLSHSRDGFSIGTKCSLNRLVVVVGHIIYFNVIVTVRFATYPLFLPAAKKKREGWRVKKQFLFGAFFLCHHFLFPVGGIDEIGRRPFIHSVEVATTREPTVNIHLCAFCANFFVLVFHGNVFQVNCLNANWWGRQAWVHSTPWPLNLSRCGVKSGFLHRFCSCISLPWIKYPMHFRN